MVIPYLNPGTTDAQSRSISGSKCHGFTPMLLPDDFPPLSELLHGCDERIPISAVEYGVRTLYEVLLDCRGRS